MNQPMGIVQAPADGCRTGDCWPLDTSELKRKDRSCALGECRSDFPRHGMSQLDVVGDIDTRGVKTSS